MNTTNQPLSSVIDNLDNAARIPALRAIVHSTMSKCIGAIRQHIRDQARSVRNEEEPQTDLDQRNAFDEGVRAEDEVKEAMGFATQLPPLRLASLFHAAYDVANTELLTLITSKWDAPLTLEQMLDFMTKNASKLDSTFVQALADAVKTDTKTIERMHELQAQREREQLIEATPEIVLTFRGFDANGYPDAVEELPKVAQHQLSVKVVESLKKARDQVLMRILRTRRLADLASVPLIEDGIKQVSEWVERFETRYKDELQEAMDAGRTVRTLDDITTP